jgi:hypothetical protein
MLEACCLLDAKKRLTAPLQELMRQLAAWPGPAEGVTVPKYTLSIEQIEQICEALINMPDQDFLRTVLHLDLLVNSGPDAGRGLHRVLSAVAARSRDFLPTGELATGRSGISLLEGLVDEGSTD